MCSPGSCSRKKIDVQINSTASRANGTNSGQQVEIYLDLACSDCATAWPTIREATEIYDSDVEFVFRLFPLPYHNNAFTASQVTGQ